MANNGLTRLTKAAREMMLESTVLASAGLFYDRAPREDKLPFCVFTWAPMGAMKKLGPRDAWRLYRLQFKAVTDDNGAMAQAQPLLDAALRMWTEEVEGASPEQRLNARLNPLGWRAASIPPRMSRCWRVEGAMSVSREPYLYR